jgi:hypothetical protein
MMKIANLSLLLSGCLIASTHARLSGIAPVDNEPPLNNNDPDIMPEDPFQAGDSLIAMQFTEDPLGHRDPMEMIRTGEIGLASLRYSPRSFAAANGARDGGYYADVHGEFCAFDFAQNKRDPAKYSTVHDIMSESEHCGEHAYSLNLREVVEMLKEHDNNNSKAGGGEGGMKTLPVAGLLFHQGYSGARLVSNALSTFDSALVISEHPALRDALNACDSIRNRYKVEDCAGVLQQRLVQDVISLLSRTSVDSPAEGLYLKLTSAGAAYLPELRAMYPDAKWTFVYRQPEHALAKSTEGKRIKACAKAKRNPTSALAAKSAQINQDLEALSHHEVCAVHLSSLLDRAYDEHSTSGTGMLISYDEDILAGGANYLMDVVLPYLGLHEEIKANPSLVENSVGHVLSNKSNVSGRESLSGDVSWKGEEVDVSEVVGNASRSYMTDSMNSILRMRK